jgi:hypothetical protein
MLILRLSIFPALALSLTASSFDPCPILDAGQSITGPISWSSCTFNGSLVSPDSFFASITGGRIFISHCSFFDFDGSQPGFILRVATDQNVTITLSTFQTIRSPSGSASLIYTDHAANFTLSGIIFDDVRSSAVLVDSKELSDTDTTTSLNRIFALSNLTVSNVLKTPGFGDLICSRFAFTSISDCHFSDCTAGSFIGVRHPHGNISPFIRGCSFAHNTVTEGGQAFGGFTTDQLTLDACAFTDTPIAFSSIQVLYIQNCQFKSNRNMSAFAYVGTSGSLFVSCSVFQNLQNGIRIPDGYKVLQLSACNISLCGRPIVAQTEEFYLQNCSFLSVERATMIEIQNPNKLTVDRCQFESLEREAAAILKFGKGGQSFVIRQSCFRSAGPAVEVSAGDLTIENVSFAALEKVAVVALKDAEVVTRGVSYGTSECLFVPDLRRLCPEPVATPSPTAGRTTPLISPSPSATDAWGSTVVSETETARLPVRDDGSGRQSSGPRTSDIVGGVLGGVFAVVVIVIVIVLLCRKTPSRSSEGEELAVEQADREHRERLMAFEEPKYISEYAWSDRPDATTKTSDTDNARSDAISSGDTSPGFLSDPDET